MYPNLSYILHSIFGTEPDNALSIIQTFGLFLALAFVGGAYFLKMELKRKADEGIFKPTLTELGGKPEFRWFDIGINGLVLGVLCTKIVHIVFNYGTFIKDPSGFLLNISGPWYILILVGGAYIYYNYHKWQQEKTNNLNVKTIAVYPHDRVGDITVIAAFSGVAGSKLFSVFEDLPAFFNNPIGTFFSGSGLNIYGGLILGFIAVFYYLIKNKIQPLHVMDAIAPALIISYAVGRMGCQLSGDGDWGIVNTQAAPSWWFLPNAWWSTRYPHNVIDDGVAIAGCGWKHCMQLAEPVFPTPVYEIILALLIFGILWAIRKRIKAPGVLFFIYMVLNGIERFWIEKIRINDKYAFLGMKMTQAEYIAVLYVIIGFVCIFLFTRRHNSTSVIS
jgi:prolipoprotein diacylglyceryl transferase